MQPKFSPSFAASVITHVVVLLMLIVSFEFSSEMVVVENSDQDSKVLNAFVVDPRPPVPVVAPAPPKPKPEEVKPAPPPPPPPSMGLQEEMEQQAMRELEEEHQVIAIEQQRQKEAANQKALVEKQLLADLKKQAAKEKKLRQKAMVKAMEKELKEQSAKALQQQLLQEQHRAMSAKMRGEVDKYKALILQAIAREWRVPGIDKKLSAELLIRVAPGGAVMDVQITRSSGDVALDNSARNAVFNASPLPVPLDEDGFEQFRQFNLKVKPQNVTSNGA